METEYIDIPCPLCKQHKVSIAVKRSVVLGFMLTDTTTHEEERTERRFTMFFTCTTKNTKFKATIALSEGEHDEIESVSVVEAKDGSKS